MSPKRIVSPHTSLSTQVHHALTDMLKNNLRPRTHEEQRERLRNLVKNREDCEIFLNDQRYVIGRLMSEMENSYGKFSNSVPPAAILCLVDEMYREIRERYEYLDLSRDVVESWIFQRLHYMYAVILFLSTHTHTLSLTPTHTHTHTHTHTGTRTQSKTQRRTKHGEIIAIDFEIEIPILIRLESTRKYRNACSEKKERNWNML